MLFSNPKKTKTKGKKKTHHVPVWEVRCLMGPFINLQLINLLDGGDMVGRLPERMFGRKRKNIYTCNLFQCLKSLLLGHNKKYLLVDPKRYVFISDRYSESPICEYLPIHEEFLELKYLSSSSSVLKSKLIRLLNYQKHRINLHVDACTQVVT